MWVGGLLSCVVAVSGVSRILMSLGGFQSLASILSRTLAWSQSLYIDRFDEKCIPSCSKGL